MYKRMLAIDQSRVSKIISYRGPVTFPQYIKTFIQDVNLGSTQAHIMHLVSKASSCQCNTSAVHPLMSVNFNPVTPSITTDNQLRLLWKVLFQCLEFQNVSQKGVEK